jgi:tRNA dimethylallyltransferase
MDLAEHLALPILCCDSVQVYRRLDIGSAKPGSEARSRVRHELVDLVEPDEDFSAGDYARRARELAEQGPGIICGGTGFYLRAAAWTHSEEDRLEDRARDDPDRTRFEAQWSLAESEQAGATHRALANLDPVTAAMIHPNNVVRALRALWLCHLAGEAISSLRARHPRRKRLELLMFVLDPGREEVDRAIDTRCDEMMKAGWLEEVEKLLAEGYDPRYKALRSLGYRQLAEFLLGEGQTPRPSPTAAVNRTIGEVVEDIKAATRSYARRQRTFFRHQFRELPEHLIVHLTDPQRCPTERAERFLRGDPS